MGTEAVWMVALALGVRAQRVVVRADCPAQAFARASAYWRAHSGEYGEPLFARLVPATSPLAGTAI